MRNATAQEARRGGRRVYYSEAKLGKLSPVICFGKHKTPPKPIGWVRRGQTELQVLV